ncbi:hypothetical protein [Leptospira weilii]|nr:hypothetical protein [Leptospira weilii]
MRRNTSETSLIDPIVLAGMEDKIISHIAEFMREQFPTFDWRWDDHTEMNDREITTICLIKNDIAFVCSKEWKKIVEFMSIVEYILEEEYGE